MMTIHATGATDPGKIRQANEDAYFVGHSVFAVADGMGGHVAGEVASSTALGPIRDLDGRVFADGAEAVEALIQSIVEANEAVSRKAEDEPDYRGMGTTLTVVMYEGRRIHFAHVGDSRAYLLRDGQFSQLTRDHTLVQQLLEDGQISQEEAATHPKRSIITRAIGVSADVEVDAMTLELAPGDQLLLCSDGLTGVVDDDDIAEILAALDPPELTTQLLIKAANRNGGPDNITAVLLRYADTPTGPGPRPGDTQDLDKPPILVNTGVEDDSGDAWVQGMRRFGTSPRRAAGRHRRRHLVSMLLAVILLIGLIAVSGRLLLGRSWYVGLDGDRVAIFQGVDAQIGPIPLTWVAESTDLTVSDVQPWYLPRLRQGIAVADLADARRIVTSGPPRFSERSTGDDTREPGETDPSPVPSR